MRGTPEPLTDTRASEWDLSHDIDVNYLQNTPRLTREEKNDIEVLYKNKYVPLNKVGEFNFTLGLGEEEIVETDNSIDRFKRNIPDSITFALETSTDSYRTVTKSVESASAETERQEISRRTRQVTREMDFTSVRADPIIVSVEGLRIEESEKDPKITESGVPSILADTKVTLRLFGSGLTSRTVIAFTHELQDAGQPCKFLVRGEYMVKQGSLERRTALFDIIAPAPGLDGKLYVCAKNLKAGIDDPFNDEEKYIHQGTETYKMLESHKKLLPLWATMILILTCLTFSALFSGLNLGLMSLDRTELKIISNTGTEKERKYARAIMPVRDHGNYLLCSILLGNVAVNSTFTILLDELTSGLFAVIFSTLAIVLLGEITPQAICSRHGLMVGAKSIMVTKAVMALTAPLAFPVSKLLDYFLGEEIGSVYNRERLKELVKEIKMILLQVTTDVNDLDKDEVNIISGALELRKKTVSDVMTKLEDVFMLPISSVLDFETMSEIIKSGYSRIPVYEGSRTNIVTVLFIKDLAFVDPDDNTPLRTLCQYYQNPCNFVFEDVTLDVIFKQFKEGHKGHMAFVHRINNEGEGDPFYETIGLVTLEDVIEELIQAEIVDETDVFLDNRSKRRRYKPQNKLQDFTAFAERHENQRIHISPQLTLATFQFLSTSVDAFKPDTVSETVLRRLLKQDVIQHIKLKGKTKKDPSTYVFQQGKPVDYFVLILEGRVEVTVGRENLVFEAGPFTYFGVQALTQNVGVAESPTPSAMGSLQNINMDAMLRHTFVPDYSVRAIAELFYLTVKRSLYLAAKRATLMEKGALSKGATNEQFDTEVDKRPSRLNIIELMQISRNYESSERLDVLSDKHSSKPSNCDRYWSRPDNTRAKLGITTKSYNDMTRTGPSKSYANACDSAKYWVNYELKGKYNSDATKHIQDIDANDCDECIRNNFWINSTLLTKSADDAKLNEPDHNKRKKTTFHTDSSLLTFHNLSPNDQDQDIDLSNIEDEYKSIDSERHRYERFLAFERDENRETERLDLEKRRIETEELMLVQLSKIIAMLERKIEF
ncbi:unnamed protein product [Arctia plantaginis]|uniref:Metal transporter CNNM4 n=1 Tax=Arctia plantaginis TaxID=874455 RepID=A0A8S1BP63_ARCPL|nr:unnamed protein product [Arctia plantaginis]